jgi:hypothetical protein
MVTFVGINDRETVTTIVIWSQWFGTDLDCRVTSRLAIPEGAYLTCGKPGVKGKPRLSRLCCQFNAIAARTIETVFRKDLRRLQK